VFPLHIYDVNSKSKKDIKSRNYSDHIARMKWTNDANVPQVLNRHKDNLDLIFC
jgi:hypothetical protein